MAESRDRRTPLRVLHVSEVPSGVLTLLRLYVEGQRAAGYDVHVLASPAVPDLDDARMHWMPLRRGRPASLLASGRILRLLVERLAPDVVHLHSFFAGLVGRVALRGSPAAVVYQPHAWSDRALARHGLGGIVTGAERAAARACDAIVVNTEEEAEHGRSFGIADDLLSVLGVGLDRSQFRPPTDDERAAARARLEVAEDTWLVLALGRLAWQKGQDLLVRAWEDDPPAGAELAVVGPGDPGALVRMAPRTWGRSIRFVPGTEDPLAWLWAADTLVLPSRYDSPGLVVAEAIACGLPVVTMAVDGSAALLESGPEPAAGARVRTVPDLMARLRERIGDERRRAAEGAAGRARAARLLDPEELHSRLATAYAAALARRDQRVGVPDRAGQSRGAMQ